MDGPDQSRRDWSQDETRPLLNDDVLPRDNYPSHKSGKKSWSTTLPMSVALFGTQTTLIILDEDEIEIVKFFRSFPGAFLASADDSFVTATYSTIASEFHRHSDGQWILMAYNMGYCYALPIVLP